MNLDIDDCAGKTCSGVGRCEDGVNDYSCKCDEGYAGKNCEKGKLFKLYSVWSEIFLELILDFICSSICRQHDMAQLYSF